MARELMIKISVDPSGVIKIDKIEDEMKQMGREAEKASEKGATGFKKMTGLANTLQVAMGNLIARGFEMATRAAVTFGQKGVGALQNFFKSMMQTTEAYSEFSISLSGAIGSLERAETIADIVAQMVLDSPMVLEDLQDIAKTLSLIPATKIKLMSPDINEVRRSLEEISDIIVSLAAIDPLQGVRGAGFALREALGGQMRSLVFRFEIPASAIAQAAGKPMRELKNDAEAMLEGLRKFTREAVGPDTLRELAKMPKVSIDAFGDLWRQALRMIGKGPVFEEYKSRLRGWVEDVTVFVRTQFQTRFAPTIQKVWVGILDNVIKIGGGVAEAIMDLISPKTAGQPFLERVANTMLIAFEKVEKVLGNVGNWFAANKEKIGETLRSWANIMANMIKLGIKITEVMGKAAGAIMSTGEKMGIGLERLTGGAAEAPGARRPWEQYREERASLLKQMQAMGGAGVGTLSGMYHFGGKEISATEFAEQYDTLKARLQEVKKWEASWTDEAKRGWYERHGMRTAEADDLNGLTQEMDTLMTLSREIVDINTMMRKAPGGMPYDRLLKQAQKYNEKQEKVLKSLAPEHEMLKELTKAAEDYAKALDVLAERKGKEGERTEKLIIEWKALADTMTTEVAAGLDAMKGKFGETSKEMLTALKAFNDAMATAESAFAGDLGVEWGRLDEFLGGDSLDAMKVRYSLTEGQVAQIAKLTEGHKEVLKLVQETVGWDDDRRFQLQRSLEVLGAMAKQEETLANATKITNTNVAITAGLWLDIFNQMQKARGRGPRDRLLGTLGEATGALRENVPGAGMLPALDVAVISQELDRTAQVLAGSYSNAMKREAAAKQEEVYEALLAPFLQLQETLGPNEEENPILLRTRLTLDRMKEQMAARREEFENEGRVLGLSFGEMFNEGVNQAVEEFETGEQRIVKGWKSTVGILNETFSQSFVALMKGELDAFDDIWKGFLMKLLDSWMNTMANIAANSLSKWLFTGLPGLLGGGGGSGSLLNPLASIMGSGWHALQEGGIIRQGASGKDNVPALLERGELVVPAHLTKQLAGLFDRTTISTPGAYQRGGMVEDERSQSTEVKIINAPTSDAVAQFIAENPDAIINAIGTRSREAKIALGMS